MAVKAQLSTLVDLDLDLDFSLLILLGWLLQGNWISSSSQVVGFISELPLKWGLSDPHISSVSLLDPDRTQQMIHYKLLDASRCLVASRGQWRAAAASHLQGEEVDPRSHQYATNMAACGLLRSLSSNFSTVLPLLTRSAPRSPLRLASTPYFGRTLSSSSRLAAGIPTRTCFMVAC